MHYYVHYSIHQKYEYYIKPIVCLFNVWIWRPSPQDWLAMQRSMLEQFAAARGSDDQAPGGCRPLGIPELGAMWRLSLLGKSWENHGKIMGKPWENHGKSWENHGKNMEHSIINKAGWWFQTFFIFRNIWDNPPIDELIFFKMVKTTNQ